MFLQNNLNEKMTVGHYFPCNPHHFHL